jgi:DNA-binding Xre family transcriptional regulator
MSSKTGIRIRPFAGYNRHYDPRVPKTERLGWLLLGIAKTLRASRRRRRWSQTRLASLSGINRRHLSEIERASIHDVRLSTVVALSDALGESFADFMARAVQESVRTAVASIAPNSGLEPPCLPESRL